MSQSGGAAAFELAYGRAPIVMTGGVASLVPGGVLPLLAISSAIQFAGGLTQPGGSISTDAYFAYFQALPGGTIIDQQVGMYPFANQAVAANAVIQQPLAISLLMYCVAGAGGGYLTASAIMQSIQQTFDQHNKSGGLYTILTPKFPYTDCVMTMMTDVSNMQTKQVQNAYKIDFVKPLVTLAAAQATQNALMNQITNGLPTQGNLSGPQGLIGNPSTGAAPAFLPSSGQPATGLPSTANGFVAGPV